jgi:hypothetical protein
MLASRPAQQSKLRCCEEFLYDLKAAPLRSAAARRRAGLCLGRPARRTPGQHAQTAR